MAKRTAPTTAVRAVLAGIAAVGCILWEARRSPAEMKVWVTHGATRTFPQDPPGEQREARIFAARNEYEPFQVIVRAEGDPLEWVTLKATDLRNVNRDSAAVIPSNNIRLFREHYVYIRSPSPRCKTAPGPYPDALIPFVDPIQGKDIEPWSNENPGGAKYDAVPCTIYPGLSQAFWVDVFVAPGTPAGDYEGSVRIRARTPVPGQAPAWSDVLVPVRLTVWSFSLPERPTVRSHFGDFSRILKWFDAEGGSERARAIERRCCEMMAEHRITPPIPQHLYPPAKEDGTIDTRRVHEPLKEYITSLHVNAFQIRLSPFRDPLGEDREKNKRYLSSMYEYLKTNGWADGAYVYILDEPNDAEAYERVRKRAAHVHEANPQIKVLCTEQTKTSDPAWGDLYGAVDIWVPLWPLHDEETAAQRRAVGEVLWSYTALCQGKGEPLWWQMDLPVLNYRIALWTNYRYHMLGLLYWTTVFWEQVKDPWLAQPSFRLAYNGEGALIYPGKDAGFDGPVASIRLKNIREGMEDYDYFVLLERTAGREEVEKEVLGVTRSWWDWEKNPDALLAARQRIAQKILSAGAAVGGQ